MQLVMNEKEIKEAIEEYLKETKCMDITVNNCELEAGMDDVHAILDIE